MEFSIFNPGNFPSSPSWENDRVGTLMSQRPVSLVEEAEEVEEGDSDGCKAWLQSGKFQSRFPP